MSKGFKLKTGEGEGQDFKGHYVYRIKSLMRSVKHIAYVSFLQCNAMVI